MLFAIHVVVLGRDLGQPIQEFYGVKVWLEVFHKIALLNLVYESTNEKPNPTNATNSFMIFVGAGLAPPWDWEEQAPPLQN